MIRISKSIHLDESEIELLPIRAQGPGGQNVNKTSSAIQLRFDISNSSLPDYHKCRLLQLSDQRISKEGVFIIKAQQFRTQAQNREDAITRLVEIIRAAGIRQKRRKPTKPSRRSKKRRVDQKVKRGKVKAMRGKVED